MMYSMLDPDAVGAEGAMHTVIYTYINCALVAFLGDPLGNDFWKHSPLLLLKCTHLAAHMCVPSCSDVWQMLTRTKLSRSKCEHSTQCTEGTLQPVPGVAKPFQGQCMQATNQPKIQSAQGQYVQATD
eukprot:1157838-Pelagomonas_calceolata.AAC.2